MKARVLGLIVWGVLCGSVARADEMSVKFVPVTPKAKTALFNGTDFSGWTKIITAEEGSDPDKTFTIVNGVIRCTGQPFGYLATQQHYADYLLKLEYRWYGQSEQMNSGVFFMKTGPDNFFLPKTIEVQLKKGSAGDLLMLSQATMNGLENPKNRVVEKITKASEKPDGQWNRVELSVRGNSARVLVNGVLQNKGTDIYVNAGQICLQSEGGPIEFRNITIEPLP